MTGTSNHAPEQRMRALRERLERFAAEWKSGSAPDIRPYLVDMHATDKSYLASLVQLDLECRWKRYSGPDTRLETGPLVDEHGFKLFPTLEDYAAFTAIPPEQLFTPELAAEEYRVRMRWGDRPNQAEYFSRFPDQPAELEAALNGVEVELLVERCTPSKPLNIVKSNSTTDQNEMGHQTEDYLYTAELPPQLDRYELESPLGHGGFGEVWKAYDPKLDRHVAIKFLRRDRRFSSEAAEQFKKEGRQLAQLGPISGIVTVFDAGEAAGHAYIVAELVEGESLATLMSSKRFTPVEAAALIAEVAAALQRAHRKGIIHRDIKPGNILIKDGSPILADFGLAVTERDQLAEARCAVGTVSYMSPEQAEGNSHLANPQTDIYSLGVILYQLLTQRLPYVANTIEEYRQLVRERPPWPLRSIDDSILPELEQICLKCLAKSPAERYSSAADLAVGLKRFVASQCRGNRRPISVLIPASAGVLLIAGLGLLWSMGPWRDGKKENNPGPSGNTIVIGNPDPPAGVSEKKIKNKWTEQLGEPLDLDFPGRAGLGGFNFEADKPATLQIGSEKLRLIQFGDLTETTFSLTLDIRLFDGRGEAGLFFGYKPKKCDGEDCSEFQKIRITDAGDNNIIVSRQKAVVRKGSPNVELDASIQTMPIQVGKQPRLEIHVEQGKLVSIEIDDIPLLDLLVPHADNVFPPASFQGPWGGFTSGGTRWFIDPKLSVPQPQQ